MRITSHSDYALRVLMYVATVDQQPITIAEIADRFRVSRTHLMKVVNKLVREGYMQGQRGKGGGVRLARPAATIRVGEVIRLMEPSHELVECMGTSGQCMLDKGCKLKRALIEAHDAFYAVLDRYTLRDLVDSPQTMRVIRLIAA